MMEISENIYSEISNRLLTAIEDTSFFNGTVEFSNEELYATLKCTLIIYRTRVEDPTGDFIAIRDIVPVWWEFEVAQERGTVLNDFSWREFRQYIIDSHILTQ